MATPQAVFGPGILICTRTDVLGTPINVGYAQEFSIDVTGTTKQLFGQNQLPLVSARGTIKTTGKFKSAVVSGIAMNALFFGQTLSTASGQTAWTVASTYSLSTASGGSTAQLQVGSSTTFEADLGVTYASNGLPFRRVSTGTESSGNYSVQSTSTGGGPGLYTFAAADTTGLTASTTLPIKVTYSSTTTAGTSLLISNQLIGTTPTFQLDYYTNLSQPTSKPFVVRVYACVASKIVMAFKLEDFMMPEFDFDIFTNASNQFINVVQPEIS